MDTVYQSNAPRSITDTDPGVGLLLFDLALGSDDLEGVRNPRSPRGVGPGLPLEAHGIVVLRSKAPLPNAAILVKGVIIAVARRVAAVLAFFEARCRGGGYDRMIKGAMGRLDSCFGFQMRDEVGIMVQVGCDFPLKVSLAGDISKESCARKLRRWGGRGWWGTSFQVRSHCVITH